LYKYLKIRNGNVIAVNDAGNPGMTYWRKGNGAKATRAYWSDLGKNMLKCVLKMGKSMWLIKAEI